MPFPATAVPKWVRIGAVALLAWAALLVQSGLAALLADAGVSGPPKVFEGRFGLFASHPPIETRIARLQSGGRD